MRATKQNTTIISNENLTGLYQVLKDHGDEVNAEKVIDLYEKKQTDEFTISFTGHFSAGKSSMINALIGTDLLPKSPIPTSANIVKLTSGEGVARIYFHDEQPIEYSEPYDLDMIKDLAKDKDTIKKIEINSSKPIIPENCSIVDTPGIDAADDTDRMITESSLHLVDVLFYIMDYNHVQSEQNLLFLKNIQSMKIPFYIIINQIDKHNENELTFSSFENSVKQTFEQWGLSPKAIYYSSLKYPETTYNQFDKIKEKIYSLFHEERILRIDASVKNIMDAHKHFLEERCEEEIALLSKGEDSNQQLIEQVQTLQQQIHALEVKADKFQQEMISHVDQTLKNAYLMPASTRDLALKFLEAQQKDFKIGFIGAKKKTEEERKHRTEEFLTSVRDSMKASMEWKLREKLTEVIKDYGILEEEILSTVQNITVSISEETLIEQMKKGAQINGDYVLNYTNDLSHVIKKLYRETTRRLIELIVSKIEHKSNEQISNHKKQLMKHEALLEVQERIDIINAELKEQLNRLELQLHTPEFTKEMEAELEEKIRNIVFKKGESVLKSKQELKKTTEDITVFEQIDNEAIPTVNRIVHIIDETVQLVEDIPAFNTIMNELLDRKDRLVNRELTIALFGAFSAGKSSFANALIGEGVLPSSPNPTTAVINRITPVTEQYKHGTVAIHLKNQDTLVGDLENMLKHFSPPSFDNLESVVHWIKQHQIQYNDELSHMYRSYLQAILKGFEEHKEIIGKSRIIGLDDFESYVTDESKACFIESIDLYYDCSITQKGITLVDTPGADSVNARHTSVAFDYIKNADAILYVTYYNHAITKADKDFVTQLGRVKESFELDKMFFIINASDLAQDETELSLVTNYVKEQLTKLGIRNPRLYPISSKKSLEEKQQKQHVNEEINRFEEDFFYFLENELSLIAIQSTIHELKRTKQLLDHFIHKANLNEQDKQQYKQELQNQQKILKESIQQNDSSMYANRIVQRISKQLHYVIERIGIRFHDIYKDFYNPTTVTESGRKAVGQLEKNMLDLLDYTGYELLQEARAVSLRIEAFVKNQYEDLVETNRQRLASLDKDFSLPATKSIQLETPEFKQPLLNLDIQMFQKAFAIFKSTKSFFVKNDKEKMKEIMYNILLPEIQAFMKETEEIMNTAYCSEWEKVFRVSLHEMEQEIDYYVSSSLNMLEHTMDISLLQEKEEQLNKLLASI